MIIYRYIVTVSYPGCADSYLCVAEDNGALYIVSQQENATLLSPMEVLQAIDLLWQFSAFYQKCRFDTIPLHKNVYNE